MKEIDSGMVRRFAQTYRTALHTGRNWQWVTIQLMLNESEADVLLCTVAEMFRSRGKTLRKIPGVNIAHSACRNWWRAGVGGRIPVPVLMELGDE